LRIQLWTYNYDPEPTGIGPVSKTLAEGLLDRGHEVLVVAAHPHYPTPAWGKRLRPYRERRNGVLVLRLPLWIGRETARERYRQELSFMLSTALVSPLLPQTDVVVSASPSFPALLPAIAFVRARGIPWVVWLHDILPDGASATGLVDEGPILSSARWLERTAYARANRIVVLSNAFTTNLVGKGVPASKVRLIYDPATRRPGAEPVPPAKKDLRILSMGNIGFSQGLAPLVDAFENDARMELLGARLIVTGTGMAADDVTSVLRSGRVEMHGVVTDGALEQELQAARIALVSQKYEGAEFNIPSKLMNFMAYGLPILAAVNPQGEVARIVRHANAGWVVDSSDPGSFPDKLAELADAPGEVDERAADASRYAHNHFTPEAFAGAFDDQLTRIFE